jgi:hypothetical protein
VLLLRRRTAQDLVLPRARRADAAVRPGRSTPLFHLFYLIPGVSLFRAWSMIIFLYALALVTLGGLAVQRLHGWLAGAARQTRPGVPAPRALWIGAAVFGVLALLASAGA